MRSTNNRRRYDWRHIAPSIIIILSILSSSSAQDFSNVPGVVVDYEELSYFFVEQPMSFIADPEIYVLSNGWYMASRSVSGWNTSSDTSGETWIYVSTDKGTNWSSPCTKRDQILRGTYFEHEGGLYLTGQHHEGGKQVVIKSTDNGTNWTYSGEFDHEGPATPNNAFFHNDRVWMAAHKDSLSAPLASNLMLSASWTREGGFPDSGSHPEWRSEGMFMGEGQLLFSPECGMAVLPKTRDLPLTGLGIVETNSGLVSFSPSNDFVSLAGGEKKFGAAYDPVSNRFYILSNPVLPFHDGSSIDPNMMRNTLAVLSSDDMRNWKVERLLLYSNNERQEGFGYPQCAFDGDDMLVMTRTSMIIPGETEPGDGRGGHDSNILNFHVWKNFRTEEPDHYLAISNNSVLRFEDTQHDDAPLEDFTLGSTFDGDPLSSPSQLGQDTNGDVYIEESGGRILRFDASGNFLETVASAPISLGAGPLDVDQPTDGSATWVLSGSDDWFDTVNWYYWNRPDTDEDIAVFGSALTGNRTITVNEPYELAGFRFLTSYNCTFSGAGFFTLASSTGTAVLSAPECSPDILIGTALGSDAIFTIGASEHLDINGINLGGNELTLDGKGTIEIANSAFTMGGGSLVIDRTELSITNSQALFDGTVEFKAPAGFAPALDDTFQILDGDLDANMFQNLVLPTLEDGLGWDTSALYSNGTIRVKVAATPVPVMETPTYANVANNSATLGATALEDGGETIEERGTVWNTTGDPTIADTKLPEGGTGTGIYTHVVGSLPAGTEIFYRGYATNVNGAGYTDTDSFYTLSTEPAAHPGSFTANAADHQSIDLEWFEVADADGYVILEKVDSDPSGAPEDAVGYSVDDTVGDGTVAAVIASGGTTNTTVSGLDASTEYHYAVYPFGYNGSDTNTYNYKTDGTPLTADDTTPMPPIPVMESPTYSNVDDDSATLGATALDDNGSPLTQRGTVWNTTGDPTTADNKLADGGTVTGIYTHARTSLDVASLIYFRGYAINGNGTGYTDTASFWTLDTEPGAHVTGFSAATDDTNTIDLAWTTDGTADGYLVVQRVGNEPTFSPVDGLEYQEGDAVGDSTVAKLISNGATEAAVIDDLTQDTTYHFRIYAFGVGSSTNTYNYKTDGTIPTDSDTTDQTPLPATINSAQSGPWTTGSTWDYGFAPNPTQDVNVLDTHVVDLDSGSGAGKKLTLESGGVLTFTGGDLTATNFEFSGSVTQTAGTVSMRAENNDPLKLESWIGSNYVMNGGVLDVGYAFEIGGGRGTEGYGSMTVNDGLVASPDRFEIAYDGVGELTINGGMVTNGGLGIIGYRGGQATMTINSGATFACDGDFFLGLDAGTGVLYQTGGTMDMNNDVDIGGDGAGDPTVGEFNISGGRMDIALTFDMGADDGSTGRVNVSGSGTIVCDSTCRIGSGGDGTLSISNGSVTADRTYVASSTGSTGLLEVSGGAYTNTGTWFEIGGGGGSAITTGSVVQTDGHVAADELYIGRYSCGFYTISGGGLVANEIYVPNGAGSNGTLTIFGGSVTSVNQMTVGDGADLGTVEISGGALDVDDGLDGNGDGPLLWHVVGSVADIDIEDEFDLTETGPGTHTLRASLDSGGISMIKANTSDGGHDVTLDDITLEVGITNGFGCVKGDDFPLIRIPKGGDISTNGMDLVNYSSGDGYEFTYEMTNDGTYDYLMLECTVAPARGTIILVK